MDDGIKNKDLPLLLTPQQFCEDLLQIEYNEDHITHLRRQCGLPHVRFQQKRTTIFRYPREEALVWLRQRVHHMPLPSKTGVRNNS